MCVGVSSDFSQGCVSVNARLLTAGATCPTVSNEDGIRTETGDTTSLQNEVATGRALPVREKFIIVITLVVNGTDARADGSLLVKMFVDLIGTGSPTSVDLEEVCTILKEALVRVDRRVPGTIDLVRCDLAEKLSVKRDASYVADMTFQPHASSAIAVAFSVALGLVALVASLF